MNGLCLNLANDVRSKVQYALKVARRNIKQLAQSAGRAFEIPDVAHCSGEFDVPHPLAPYA